MTTIQTADRPETQGTASQGNPAQCESILEAFRPNDLGSTAPADIIETVGNNQIRTPPSVFLTKNSKPTLPYGHATSPNASTRNLQAPLSPQALEAPRCHPDGTHGRGPPQGHPDRDQLEQLNCHATTATIFWITPPNHSEICPPPPLALGPITSPKHPPNLSTTPKQSQSWTL